MTIPPEDIILGVTHLKVGGEIVRLYKCPYCSFRNIHESEITHHIKYKKDGKHAVNVDELDKKLYVVNPNARVSNYSYVPKEKLPLPWVKCLWCSYKDNIRIDLEWHMFNEHKNRLYQMRLSPDEMRWSSDTEYRINKAVWLAVKKSRVPMENLNWQ